MNKLSGFVLLFAVIVLVSVSYLTYAKNASAIYFGNGACPSGEARDFMGVCYPIKECRGGPFQGAGTCSVSTVTKGEGGKVTVTAPEYKGSPVHLPGGGIIKKGWCTLYPLANKLLNKLDPGVGGQGGEKETCAETK